MVICGLDWPKLQKSFKETPLKREVTIVATGNEASEDEDKTEKESATEIKKLDARVSDFLVVDR